MAFVVVISKCNSECVITAPCRYLCPVDCISLVRSKSVKNKITKDKNNARRKILSIDEDRCIDCGECSQICLFDAIISEDEID